MDNFKKTADIPISAKEAGAQPAAYLYKEVAGNTAVYGLPSSYMGSTSGEAKSRMFGMVVGPGPLAQNHLPNNGYWPVKD